MDGLPEDEVEVESWTSRYFWDFPFPSHQPLFIAEKEEILKKISGAIREWRGSLSISNLYQIHAAFLWRRHFGTAFAMVIQAADL